MPRSSLLSHVARLARRARLASPGLPKARPAPSGPTRRAIVGAGLATAGLAAFGRVGRGLAGPTPRVAIVGAGIAGLVCAQQLQRWGVIPVIYERGGRIGGRIKSVRGVFPGQVAEAGGEFIDTTHQTMRGLARDLGLTLENVEKAPGDATFDFDGQRWSEGQIVDEYCVLVDRMRPDLKSLSGAPDAFVHNDADVVFDHTDLETYLDQRAADLPVIRKVLLEAYVAEYGLEAAEQSCLNMLLFLHLDCRAHFSEFGVWSDERFHVVEGNDAITTGLADAFTGTLATGARLTKLAREGGRYKMTFGSAVEYADAVVLTLPFTALRQVELDPGLGLSDGKRKAIAELAYGKNCKTMIGFQGRPWVDLYGASGLVYSDRANLQNTWETSFTTSRGTSILTDYASGDRGHALQVLPPPPQGGSYCYTCHNHPGFMDIDDTAIQAQAEAFLADLDAVWPGVGALATREGGRLVVARGHWEPQPSSQGSYTCYAPGQFTTIAGYEGQSAGGLKFAGEHADSFYSWQGFMEGAALSGVAAADEILADIAAGRL